MPDSIVLTWALNLSDHYFMPENNKKVPSLYEWAGGKDLLEKLTKVFYEKVLQDKLLEPLFRKMPSDHPKHVAHFIGEVMGGPPTYSQGEGSHYQMILKHLSKHITEEQRQQWIRLLMQSADEVGLPDDPEFRSAFMSYIEWGTRIAKINSNEESVQLNTDAPMPAWGWGEVKGPYIG